MKLAIRVLVVVIALSGFAAASVSSTPSLRTFPSHQAVAAGMPVPACGPSMCTNEPQKPSPSL
jgi:hypothetical protein